MAFAEFQEKRFRIDREIDQNHAILVNLTATDGGPTLFHNWVNVSCYPGSGLSGDKASVHPYAIHSKHGTITQFCFNVGLASSTIDRHWNSNGAATLAQHWTSIVWGGLHCVYEKHRIDAYGDGGGRNRPTRWRFTCLFGFFFNYILDI